MHDHHIRRIHRRRVIEVRPVGGDVKLREIRGEPVERRRALIRDQVAPAPTIGGLQRRVLWPRASNSVSTPRRKCAFPWFQSETREWV